MSEHDMSQQDIQRALRTLADVMSERESEALPDRERRMAENRRRFDAELEEAEDLARSRGNRFYTRRMANARARSFLGESPDDETKDEDDETTDDPVTDVRPMRGGYFSQKPDPKRHAQLKGRKSKETARTANSDSPMVPRAVLLAPPEKKAGGAK